MSKELKPIPVLGNIGVFFIGDNGKLMGVGSAADHRPRTKKRRGKKWKNWRKK